MLQLQIMIINKKFEFNFNISEPRQKNNIVLFYLSNQEQVENNYITLPEAFSKNLVKVEEVNTKICCNNFIIYKSLICNIYFCTHFF